MASPSGASPAVNTPGGVQGGTPGGTGGRGGSRLGVRKSSCKRRSERQLRPALERISDGSLRRLARRGGIQRMGRDVLNSTVGIRGALRWFLDTLIYDAGIMAEHARRHTVIGHDIAYALKKMGRPIYMKGCDYTYGIMYTRESVRRNVEQPLSAAELQRGAQRAAQRRANSRASAAAPAASVRQGEQRVAAAPATAVAAEQGQAAAEAAAPDEVAAQLEPLLQAAAEPEAEQAAAAEPLLEAAAEPALSQQGEQPSQGEASSPPAAEAAVHCSGYASGDEGSEMNTPAPITAERARELQARLSAVMHPLLSAHGKLSERRLYQEMLKQGECTKHDFMDVLYTLEKVKDVFMRDAADEDTLYFTGA